MYIYVSYINLWYSQLTVKPSPFMVDLLAEEVVDCCQLRKAGNSRTASLLSFWVPTCPLAGSSSPVLERRLRKRRSVWMKSCYVFMSIFTPSGCDWLKGRWMWALCQIVCNPPEVGMAVVVIRQKCLNPPKSENEREMRNRVWLERIIFNSLRGKLFMSEVFYRKTYVVFPSK